MSETQLNIYQKLAKIRKPVEVLRKNKSGYGYKYVSEELILAKITGLMDKYGVSLIPEIVRESTTVTPWAYKKTKSTKDGKIFEENVNEIIVHSDMVWRWVNNDQPDDCIVVPWTLVGSQSDASQAFGSGLTYSSRYFLLKYFNVATTEDDPDNWRTLQKEAEEEESRVIAKAIVDQAHSIVSSKLEALADDERKAVREQIITITKKYAVEKGRPSTNYYAITNPVVASKLLTEIRQFFNVEDKEAA